MSLVAAQEAVYQAFASVPRPRNFDICLCCVSEDDRRVALSTPLRDLKPDQLSAYASSVFLTVGGEADFRYFLPRILQLSIERADWWPSREVVLRALKLADWLKWSSEEVEALRALLVEAFAQAIDTGDAWEVDGWVCAIARAGMNPVPLLRRLEEPTALPLLISFFELNSAQIAKGKLMNAFWDDEKEFMAAVVNWFNTDDVQAVIGKHYGA
jgi:hypothetical protein